MDSEGSAIALSSLSSIKAELYDQDKNVIQSYEYPSTNFRLGSTSNMIEMEIVSSVSLKFTRGNIYVRFILEKTDSNFTTEGKLIDKISEAILEVSE